MAVLDKRGWRPLTSYLEKDRLHLLPEDIVFYLRQRDGESKARDAAIELAKSIILESGRCERKALDKIYWHSRSDRLTLVELIEPRSRGASSLAFALPPPDSQLGLGLVISMGQYYFDIIYACDSNSPLELIARRLPSEVSDGPCP